MFAATGSHWTSVVFLKVYCDFIATHCSVPSLQSLMEDEKKIALYTLTWELLPKYVVVKLGDSEEKRKTRTPIMYAMV